MRSFIISCVLMLLSVAMYAQTSSDKLIRQGVSLHDKGRYADAIECYKEAIKINPYSMSAMYEMSLSYLHLNDFQNAIKYSTCVIEAEFQPLLMDAYIVQSTALAESGDMGTAISILNQAIDRCGDSYLLHFNLGLSYFNSDNKQKAIDHLQRAIEIDATHASAFLMYAYALNDSGKWLRSFYAFHFFLLLEPNTERSKDAFDEMYDILYATHEVKSEALSAESGVSRKLIYDKIQAIKPKDDKPESQYKFFEEASEIIFFSLMQMQTDDQQGLLWNFFVPVYSEILESGFHDVYCRYVSVTAFPESLTWWDNNKDKVDNFIEWFERGQSSTTEMDEEDLIEGDEEL